MVFFLSTRLDHFLSDIIERPADFFAGVEDVGRVENLFCLDKELINARAEHEGQVRRADDAVVVLGGDGAFVLDDEVVDAFAEFEDDIGRMRILEIHERDDVEIAVAEVAGDGVGQIVLRQDRLKFRHEFGQEFRFDDDVVDEWRGPFSFYVLAQEVEALAADLPVFLRFGLGAGDVGLVAEIFDVLLRLNHDLVDFCGALAREFGHEDQFRQTGGQNHAHFWQELPAEFDEAPGTELLVKVKEEFHGQFHAVVVVSLEAFRLEGEELVDQLAGVRKIRQEDGQDVGMCRSKGKFEGDLSDDAQCALRAGDEATQVEGAGGFVIHIPQIIAGGVFGYIRFCGHDGVIVGLDEGPDLFI